MAHKLSYICDDEHRHHMASKKEARAEKENDKVKKEFVFAVDVQALLSAPKSNISSLYYKLNIHNFCAFNLKTKDGYRFIWRNGGRGFGWRIFISCCWLIVDKILPLVNRETMTNKIKIYSDGSAAQNRNVTISNALLNVAMTNNITIEQKYLEVGYTQIEVDSMHASIERRLRNKIMNVPAEYCYMLNCS